MTDAYLNARNGDVPREVTYVMPVRIIISGLDHPKRLGSSKIIEIAYKTYGFSWLGSSWEGLESGTTTFLDTVCWIRRL